MANQNPKSKVSVSEYSTIREFKGETAIASELERYGAHAIGIGRKVVKGKSTDQLASRVYVEKKKPKSRLSSFEKVPENLHYLTRKKGDDVTIVTDVIETPRAVLEQFDPEDRHRPVEGGLSGGISGHTGTIGGWVWDETDDTIVMRFRIAFH